jgi:putative DNA primase/helicase
LHPPLGVYEPFYIGTKKQIDLTRSIVFRNGIYHVLENRFEALSPDIFITSTLPYDYNPNAQCNLWLWFIEDIFDGDDECIRLLQEWFGYNLIASNHMEQMMFLFGVPGSGKSTVVSVLEALLGPDRYYAMDIEQFTTRFGLESLIGKYALIISDDSETDKKKLNKLLNRFKRITGQDTMNINRRYRQSINIKPTWRVTYAGNDLPQFSDEPQALLRRLNLLYFANNYYKTKGGPDRTLKNRLVKEAQGIAMWAIEGLQRLLRNDYFTQPRASLQHIEDYNLFVNPLRAMVEECCKIYDKPAEAIKHQTPRDYLFELHKVWYEENNLKSLGKAAFGMRFHHLGLPQSVQKKRIRQQGGRMCVYEGIEILPEVFRKYLGGLK